MSVISLKFRDQADPRRHDPWTTPSHLAGLNDHGLLTASLRCENPEKVARALLARFRGLAGVFGADEFALRGVEGMARDDIIDVMLIQETAVRIARGGNAQALRHQFVVGPARLCARRLGERVPGAVPGALPRQEERHHPR